MTATKDAWFAVRTGRIPGLYKTWKECEEQIKGFSRASYRKFNSYEEAKKWYNRKDNSTIINGEEELEKIDNSIPSVYVDGSVVKGSNIACYGWAYLILNNDKIIAQDKGGIIKDSDTYKLKEQAILDRCKLRNISGELTGVMMAIVKCKEMGYTDINIFHDYEGIKLFANEDWKSKIDFVNEYTEFVKNCGINIHFHSMKSHTGFKYNEIVDENARKAAKADLESISKNDTYEAKYFNKLLLGCWHWVDRGA